MRDQNEQDRHIHRPEWPKIKELEDLKLQGVGKVLQLREEMSLLGGGGKEGPNEQRVRRESFAPREGAEPKPRGGSGDSNSDPGRCTAGCSRVCLETLAGMKLGRQAGGWVCGCHGHIQLTSSSVSAKHLRL